MLGLSHIPPAPYPDAYVKPVGRYALHDLCQVRWPGGHIVKQDISMCNILMKRVREIDCLWRCVCKSLLYVIRVPYGPRN